MRRAGVGEWGGVTIALVSSCLGGTAAAITRYLAGNTDPITLAILRWAIGFCCVLPAALLLKARWPQRRDWPRPLQHRDVLHDGGARQPRAGDAAAAHHGGRRLAWHRAADETEVDRCRRRRAWRLRGAGIGTLGRAAGSLARRADHDGGRIVHGVLQRLVPPFHPAIERAWLSHCRHGNGRRGADPGWLLDGKRRGVEPVQHAAMDRRHLSRRRWRR